MHRSTMSNRAVRYSRCLPSGDPRRHEPLHVLAVPIPVGAVFRGEVAPLCQHSQQIIGMREEPHVASGLRMVLTPTIVGHTMFVAHPFHPTEDAASHTPVVLS